MSAEIPHKVKESGRRQETKDSGRTKAISEKERTRHTCVRDGTDARGRADEKTDRAAGRRGTASKAAATDQQEATALKATGASKRPGEDDAVATGGAGQTMVEKAEAARETAGGPAAEGAEAENTANPGDTDAPEFQSVTHQETNSGGEGSTIPGCTSSADTSNGESSGVMMSARRAKMGIKTDRDGGARRQADGYGNSRGDGKTVISINNTNRGGNPNMRTYTRAGK